jgi:hypothetical protein
MKPTMDSILSAPCFQDEEATYKFVESRLAVQSDLPARHRRVPVAENNAPHGMTEKFFSARL